MKLGIIGSGLIVQEFLPKMVKLEGLEVVAIQGRKPEQLKTLCEENGVPHAVTNFHDLCATGVDTAYIAVPNALHFDYCKQALEAGLNVIVEKPMTSNYKEAMHLQKMAEEKGLFLFEAITTLHLESFQKIQEWLPRIGTVKLAQSQLSQYSRRYDAFLAGEVLPVFDPQKSGGAMMDLNLYNIHLIMGLFGQPKDVCYYANIERGIDTSGVLMMQYDGFQALCLAAKDCRGSIGATIQGTGGCIRTTRSPNSLGQVILELNDGTKETFDEPMVSARLIPEFTDFISAINARDLDYCRAMLKKSVAVSWVQTEARLNAGIRFPSDGEIV